MPTGCLMYHELERAGQPLAEDDPGYVRYAVGADAFAAQLAWIRSAGLRGTGLGQARRAGFDAPGRVVITFDDGCETDWTAAAPLLLEHGFGATFYVVSRWIGRRPGFMSRGQLRALGEAGFEIGSHSATHAFLPDLGEAALRAELADSKHEIEDIVGVPVTQFSCPGGRWDRRVAETARAVGYESVATSRFGANDAAADPFALARCAVRRDTPQATFETYARGAAERGLRHRALDAAKVVLGNRMYTTLRRAALKRA